MGGGNFPSAFKFFIVVVSVIMAKRVRMFLETTLPNLRFWFQSKLQVA